MWKGQRTGASQRIDQRKSYIERGDKAAATGLRGVVSRRAVCLFSTVALAHPPIGVNSAPRCLGQSGKLPDPDRPSRLREGEQDLPVCSAVGFCPKILTSITKWGKGVTL